MTKKVLAILLALGLCFGVFAACGNSEQVATNNGGSSAPASSGSSGSAQGGQSAPADTDEEEEAAEINVALMCFAPMDQNATGPVVDAINELTERDINVHVNISWYDAATYGSQVPMQIQAGEKLDIIMFTPVPGASYPSYRSANQLMDISDLLDEYGPTVKARLGNLLSGVSYGDAVYGIPHYRSLTGHETVYIRKDIADAAGVTEDLLNAKSWTDLHDAFVKMTAESGLPAMVNTDAEGTVMYPKPFYAGSDDFAGNHWYDALGDGYNMITSDYDSNTVQSYFATEEYKAMCERVHQWYEDGLVYKDAATSQEYADTLVKSGVGYAQIRASEIGTLEASSAATGYELIGIDVTDAVLGTNSTTKFGYAVPVVSTEPEAAIRFINYLYESSDAMNILTWGVEGRDWELNADGQGTYPAGVTADSVQYHTADFLYGDQMLIVPWEGSDLDIREQQQHEMDVAQYSKFMGFTLDTEGLQNTITACKTVIDRYAPMLAAGSVSDVEGTIERFNADLSAAGMDDLLAAYQAQLDQWLADNG